MREYGQIQSAFWTSDVRDCSDGAKLLACYLMTGPHTNGVGCFLLPDGYIQEDHPNWSKEQISERFDELSRNGFAYRFERVCYMPKFLTWNTIANGNIARARYLDWVAVPKGLSRQCAAFSMLALSNMWREGDKIALKDEISLLSIDLGNGSLNGLRNGLANLFLKLKNQHPTPPQNTLIERSIDLSLVQNPKKAERKTRTVREPDPRFAEFWKIYPRKVQRTKAAIAFAKIDPSTELLDRILSAVRAWSATDKWRFEPDFIPHPTTWLNGERWLDELPRAPPQGNPTNYPASKTRNAVENLMRGVNGHELDRTGNPSRTEQTGLLELGSDASDGHARRHR